MNEKDIRTRLRQQRRAIAPELRASASERICESIASRADFQNADKVAAFLAFDGEVDLAALISTAWDHGKRVFLPIVIGKSQPLSFACYEQGTAMERNRFGILQPNLAQTQTIDPGQLDLVLTPLVAFDHDCNRIGVGGGFYDRTFAFAKLAAVKSPPIRIGVAFELQRVDAITPQSWDVSLNAVVTEQKVYGT